MNESIANRPDDDWLERALRAEGVAHRGEYVADEGFTARVLARLPAQPSLPRWRKPAVTALWAAAGAATALALPDLYADALRESLRLAAQPVSLPQLAAAVVLLGAAGWTGIIWALRRS
jgi:hypothetical protein